jgi:rhodanese-related sulfurtransferase
MKLLRQRLTVIFLFLFAFFFETSAFAASADEFPMRARYPDVQYVTTAQLANDYSKVVIVDVRTKYEYDTLHITDAVLLPLGIGFGEKVLALRKKVGDNKQIVFYCNGKTCHKSYEAATLAEAARVTNVAAYDAGIFDWAKAQPERTVLRGHSPIKPGELITADDFKAHQLDPKAFEERIGNNSIVLDVRDTRQRDSALFPFKEKRAPLDDAKKIEAVVAEAKSNHKTLLVYDAVGKQVQWLQYHLEGAGLKDYYFMKGGAQGYFDATLGTVVLGGEAKLNGNKVK